MTLVPIPRVGGDEAIARLPLPLYLYRELTASDHYHLGHYAHLGHDARGASADDSLLRGMDRLVTHAFEAVPARARVLDVGCGMGGSARLLAERGHDVVAVDQDAASIDYARTRDVRVHGARAPLFLCDAIEDRTVDELGGPFDVVLLLEVQQHFPDPAYGCRQALRFLRPGGALLFLDLAVTRNARPVDCPFFGHGEFARAAESLGFTVEHDEDLTAHVRPTLALLDVALAAERPRLLASNADRAGAIRAELAELEVQVAALARALDAGELRYHLTRLRLGTESTP